MQLTLQSNNFFKKKKKTNKKTKKPGPIRIINLFPSCYVFLKKSKNMKKN